MILDRLKGQQGVKVADLEAKRAELEARDRELLAKQNRADEEFKALGAERPNAGAVRRLEIDFSLEKLQQRYDQLQQERERVAEQLGHVLRDLEYHGRRLREAQRTVDVMENHPESVQDLSPAVRRAEYERAKQTIKELT